MIHWLPSKEILFPHPVLTDESGVLALGGDLSPQRLINAYLFGIFPWYNNDEPIIWWFLNPRMVLFPHKVKVSKSMRSILNKGLFEFTFNKAFNQVIDQCASAKRPGQNGTWIHEEIKEAFKQLHEDGIAVSVETWHKGKLVGGLYGLSIGKIFFGESMFSIHSNASKAALIHLTKELERREYLLIDCQQDTAHMRSMGAELLDADTFLDYLRENQKTYLSNSTTVIE